MPEKSPNYECSDPYYMNWHVCQILFRCSFVFVLFIYRCQECALPRQQGLNTYQIVVVSKCVFTLHNSKQCVHERFRITFPRSLGVHGLRWKTIHAQTLFRFLKSNRYEPLVASFLTISNLSLTCRHTKMLGLWT